MRRCARPGRRAEHEKVNLRHTYPREGFISVKGVTKQNSKAHGNVQLFRRSTPLCTLSGVHVLYPQETRRGSLAGCVVIFITRMRLGFFFFKDIYIYTGGKKGSSVSPNSLAVGSLSTRSASPNRRQRRRPRGC